MYLVTGATGNVGAELVRILTETGHKVRALARPDNSTEFPKSVERATGDLNDPDSLNEALMDVRGIFLLPGYNDAAMTLANARAAGVEHVVQLSGRSAGNADTSDAISRYMAGAETIAKESGLGWTILRPCGFMSNTLEWVPQILAGELIRAPFPEVAIAMIDPADIASVAAAALTEDGHHEQTYPISGPEPLTPGERVEILADVLARPIPYEGMTREETREHLVARMPKPYADAIFGFFGEGKLDESRVLPTVEDVTGQSPRTFRHWATQHADAFKPPLSGT